MRNLLGYFAPASAAVNLSSASLRKLVRTPEGEPNSISWSVAASYLGQAGPDAQVGVPVLAKATQQECISVAIALSSSDGGGGAGGAAAGVAALGPPAAAGAA